MKEENPSSLIKKTLFGRKSELKLLFDQLNLVKEGYRGIIHISGAYGSGKSKLLSTFYDSIESDATLFLRGQFSQNIGNSPKDAFIQAIRQFAKIILTKPEQEVNAWKIIMKEALQVTSKSLIKMIPDLEVLVDKSNPGDFDRSININFPFTKLIKSIPSIHNPLVLVIENLQYADKDSWDTLQTLIKDRTIKYFLLITTSDAELDDDHFRSYLDQIKDYEHISLANYTVGDIQESLTELRFQSPRMLAEILHTKTAGFPQSLSYLLERLIHRKEISYDETSSEWGWSSEHLQTMASIEQGTGLLVQLYKGLTPNSQKLYQYAALLGNEFSIQHLHEISQRSIREIVRILEEGIADNLVQQNDKEFYQFVSPKFLEIILDRLDTTELGKIHLEIANQFLEGYKSSESISIFQIAYHYNAAESILPQKDLDRLVMVNEMAGREALNSAAFDYALDHFSKAIDYIPAKAWDEDYQRTFKIYLDATFAASISNHVDKMESWMDLAMIKAKNIFDRVSLYEIKLDHLTENHKFPETVQLLQRVLKEIGYPIKRNPSMLVILKEFLRVMIRLRGRHPHALLELPEMTNQKALAFMRLTVNAATSIFGSAPDILPIVFF